MTHPPFTRGAILLILSVISLIGLALRIYHLNFQSLWFDELHSIVPTDPASSLSSIIEYCKRDQPPGYFIFLHYFLSVFGYNEVVGRNASVLLGVLAIPVMFFFGKEIKGQGVGIAAALLTSLNYMHIYYSQELRFYTMAFLTTALSFLFLIRAYKKGSNWDFFFYSIFTAALLYTHYYGLVICAAQAFIFLLLLLYKRDRTFFLKSTLAGLSVVILYLPWLPVILSDLQIQSFWIRKPHPFFLADYFYYYFGKDAVVTTIFIFLIFLFFRAFLRNDKSDAALKPIYLVLVAWLVLSYLIPYIKSVVDTPMLYVRYTMVSLPVWILIISLGWDQLRNGGKLKYGLLVLISMSMILNLFFIRKHYVRIDKQQFREVSEFIKERDSPHPVYSVFAWHYNFYFRDHRLKIQEFDPVDVTPLDAFWLLQVEFFSPDEKAKVIESLHGEFAIVESHPFHKTEAVLLKRINK